MRDENGRFIKGQHYSFTTEFKIGKPSPRKGIKKTGWTNSTSFKRQNTKLKYTGIHAWLRRVFGRAEICEFCGSNETPNWANISGNYLEDIRDWLQLCRKCHHKFDNISEKAWITRRSINI